MWNFGQRSGPQKRFTGEYWLTRIVFLRLLGFIYFIGFLSLSRQLRGLIGRDGILPASLYLERAGDQLGGAFSGFMALPSLFWWNCSDSFMLAFSGIGILLSLLLLFGYANGLLLLLLWFLYMSFVHVGQLFYGFGWEILLLETGFLAIFLCPFFKGDPLPRGHPPSRIVVWLFRWLLFRLIFGAGLIKLRGDPCWRDLTCLFYHFETQPLPNPLSWLLHQSPPFLLMGGVLFNHFVELIAPWFLFAPRRLRHTAGFFQVLFQFFLISSGNLSWLNWLTIAVCVPTFDDRTWRWFFTKKFLRRSWRSVKTRPEKVEKFRRAVNIGLALLVVVLSLNPIRNMISPGQVMNTSFDRLHLVNTYGAFGTVGKVRREVILEGADDPVLSATTKWREYEFKMKPGNVNRRPGIISPYHYRIDWQIWFAAMSDYQHNPWLVHFISKLLQGDEHALGLLAGNPFENGPPKYIRAELYEYHFTRPGDSTEAWWTRQRIGSYLPPLSSDNPSLRRFLALYGWEN